jgi:hypothetical protein
MGAVKTITPKIRIKKDELVNVCFVFRTT